MIEKKLFNQCLLHVTSLRGLGVKANAKKKQSKHNNAINGYPTVPP